MVAAEPTVERVQTAQPARRQFWGTLGYSRSSPLVPYTAMDGPTYVATLTSHLLPLLGARGLQFQQDNAPAHRSRIAAAFLAAHRVRVLAWPPFSPDLSIIENVWGEVKRIVKGKRALTTGQIEHQTRLAWRKVTSDRRYVAALFGSIPSRLQEVLDRKGKAIDC